MVTAKPRSSAKKQDKFCNVYVKFTPKTQKSAITALVKNVYELYFDCHLGDQNKPRAPHIICIICANILTEWLKETR